MDTYSGSIDLLLTDVILPERSGVALAAEISRRRPTLPTLFMTGYEAQEFGGEMPAADRILRKPFAVAELQSRVQRALDDPST